MNASNAKRFRDLLRGMGSVYQRDLDAAALDAYWIALNDWELSEFEEACAYLLKTAKFMPRPSEFCDLRKQSGLTTDEAFANALEAARSASVRELDTLEVDALTDAAVRCVGGYRALAMSDPAHIGHLQRRFQDAYRAVDAKIAAVQALPHLRDFRRAKGLPDVTDEQYAAIRDQRELLGKL